MGRMMLIAALAATVASPALASSAGTPIRTSVASANPAAALSLTARRGATLRHGNALEGENTLLLVIAAALVGGVIGYLIGDDDDKEEPASP